MGKELLDRIVENYYEEEFLTVDGFDEAVIGIEENEMRLIYSVKKCLEIIARDETGEDGDAYENAYEYFTFNVSNAYVGKQTPIWCWDNFE